MTDEERKRRKAIWDNMTEEERQEAENKRMEIFSWCNEESEKAWDKIIAEGRYIGGLDGHYPELIEISKERDRKIAELLEKIFGEATTSQ